MCGLILASVKLHAQYPVAVIPDSLTKDARVVTRLDEKTIELKSPGKASVHEHHVFTIMSESGKAFGSYVADYDKFKSLNDVSGTLYDANGKEIKHVKKKDFADESGSGDETLMTDTRYKVFNFAYGIYPYTVEFVEDYDLDGILDLDDWVPQPDFEVAVQESHCIVTSPSDYVLRYKALNGAPSPEIAEQSGKKKYIWSLKNIIAKKSESYAPELREILPYVMISPSQFEAQGFKGDMSTWKGYGKFIYDLLQGRDILPDDVKKKVHELADGIKDPYEKISVLYDYLQKNTRYISIQLGLGGLQPFDAGFVAAKHYGDCKALSNYMVALLKEAGIKANSVSVASGEDAPDIIEDFPRHQFNHRITCVPLNGDTLWLECTNQTMSPGYMGSFTGNRKALVADENGGYLANTPVYTASDNVSHRKVVASIDVSGNLDADIQANYKGMSQELPHGLMYEVSKEDREKYLNNMLNLPTYQVTKNDFKEKRGRMPEVDETLHIVSQSYASASGKRLFLAPNLFSKSKTRFSADSARKYDIEFKFAYRDIDSITLKIPDGYSPEAIPKNVSISNKFGIYNLTIKIDGANVYCYRFFENRAGTFHPVDYLDLVKFYDDMYKADRSKIVFVRKEG